MKKKTKILFRHRSMEMGGVEKVLIRILENLDQDKFEASVLLSLNQGELRDDFPAHVKKSYLVKGKEDLSQNYFIQKIELFLRRMKLNKLNANPHLIDQKFLNENFDIEVAITYSDYDAILNSTNKNSKKIGWIHSEINTPGLQPKVPMITSSIEQFDTMIYGSQRVKNLFHELHPNLKYPTEKVILNAIPIDEIKEKANQPIENDFPKSNVPTFISAGRLHNRKGYHTLMEAHNKLIKDGFNHQVIIIGNGEEKENLSNKIKEYGLENSFYLLGNKMNPYTYIKNADFFVLSSRSEAWPLILAEALILEKPTIGTDCGDVSTVLEHNKTGLLINYDEKEMYQAMKRFLTEPQLIQGFKDNLKLIEDKFDSQKIYNEIEQTFLDLVKHD